MKISVKQLCCVDGCHDEACPGCGGMCIDHAYEEDIDKHWEWHCGNYNYAPANPCEVYARVTRDDNVISLDDIPF